MLFFLQDDHVMGTLTVRENLMFSANLRLPSGITLEEKKLKVDETVEELGLTLCQDSKVTTTSGKICRKVFSNRRYALINRGTSIQRSSFLSPEDHRRLNHPGESVHLN